MKARVRAAQILAEVLAGQSLSGAWSKKTQSLPDNQQALCRELVYGTLREWPLIDGLLQQLLQKPFKQKDQDIHALVALGIYQLKYMRVPEHAAVSETVGSVTGLKKAWARGLVNGVLRNYQRRCNELEHALTPAAQSALPDWLYTAISAEKPESLADISAASRSHPPMFLRVNQQHGSREQSLLALSQAGIAAQPHESVSSAIRLETPADVSAIPGFMEGHYSVQDAAAQVAAELLAPVGGERILDACAAPGGKSCHIAELLDDASTLIAADVSDERLRQVVENRDRLQLNFQTLECDARSPGAALGETLFDAILLDVPCSATGVLRRNPDVKVIRCREDIDQFTDLQREILAGIWPRLKPGGRLIYATCSLLSAENDAIAAWASETLPGASLATLSHPLATATQHGIQCVPSLLGGDGLYYAKLVKAQ